MQELLNFVRPTAEMVDYYGIGGSREKIADQYLRVLGQTDAGRAVLADIVANTGVMDTAPSERHDGTREAGLTILGIIKIGIENERQRRNDGSDGSAAE